MGNSSSRLVDGGASLNSPFVLSRRLAPFYPPLEHSPTNDPISVIHIIHAHSSQLIHHSKLLRLDLYQSTLECPICFLSFPRNSNYSTCCNTPICSSCFVKFTRRNPELPEPCPFCQTPNFKVSYIHINSTKYRQIYNISSPSPFNIPLPKPSLSFPIFSQPPPVSVDDIHPDYPQRIAALRAEQLANQSRPAVLSPIITTTDIASTATTAARLIESIQNNPNPTFSSIAYLSALRQMDTDIEDIMLMEAIRQSIQESNQELSRDSHQDSHQDVSRDGNQDQSQDVSRDSNPVSNQDSTSNPVSNPTSNQESHHDSTTNFNQNSNQFNLESNLPLHPTPSPYDPLDHTPLFYLTQSITSQQESQQKSQLESQQQSHPDSTQNPNPESHLELQQVSQQLQQTDLQQDQDQSRNLQDNPHSPSALSITNISLTTSRSYTPTFDTASVRTDQYIHATIELVSDPPSHDTSSDITTTNDNIHTRSSHLLRPTVYPASQYRLRVNQPTSASTSPTQDTHHAPFTTQSNSSQSNHDRVSVHSTHDAQFDTDTHSTHSSSSSHVGPIRILSVSNRNPSLRRQRLAEDAVSFDSVAARKSLVGDTENDVPVSAVVVGGQSSGVDSSNGTDPSHVSEQQPSSDVGSEQQQPSDGVTDQQPSTSLVDTDTHDHMYHNHQRYTDDTPSINSSVTITTSIRHSSQSPS